MENHSDNQSTGEENRPNNAQAESGWGAMLFVCTLGVVLMFFYWLLVYSGGVVGHHG